MADHIKGHLWKYLIGALISFTLIGVKVSFTSVVEAQMKPLVEEMSRFRQDIQTYNERLIRIETQHELEKGKPTASRSSNWP